ncbi:Aa3-type cytochrome c oxidase subunit IV [Pseudooceanicola batsensis HTCC2597]|uniref:Aa3-type cytochrome c oxidase subunit IV n=1 Tax=Pseudooceanicola batsensis (strain ATCC BAA-863 / DSM 15984 / KCTC 12145 / HTCC2597) TaxID=252305 RepID=A3TV99_PSEBH|nr:aa3-type cytochrome c oxidase subunit IV [Pseudooceanicola batsensis]EAQ04445.1 Aa3-type cytochrome c oxidase subunit IV [Pseudooceanicola batsensis HTCC2597]
MAEHKHGEMDIEDQEKTFDGFVKMSTWVAVISIGILIFLALFNS